jgi:branched-chain amino acid transport system permease protein
MNLLTIQDSKIKILFLSILGLLVLLFPVLLSKYYLSLVKLAGIGIILSLGMNIFFGYCGQINFGGAAFYALGAYISALLQLKLGLHFFAALPLTLVACLLAALIIGVPLLRLRHHTLALGTVAFAMVIYLILNTWISLTGGEDGLAVPKLLFYGYKGGSTFYYYFILVFVVLSYLTCHFLVSSRVGRAMRAIREDEVAALSMGINSGHYIRLAFMLNGLFCGLSGILFAQESGWITPSTFHLWTNVVLILMVVVGGVSSNFGAVLGGAIIMLLPQVLGAFQQYHVLIYGLILALTLRFMPRGIVGFIQETISRLVRSLEKIDSARP